MQTVENIGVATTQANAPASLNEIAPRVLRQSPQPAAKTACWIISEGPHFVGEPGQDHLGNVFGVGVLQPPLATPAVDLSAVALNKLRPGRLISGRTT